MPLQNIKSTKIVERITKYLQKVIDDDQFEEHYQNLVDSNFNLDDLYLGVAGVNSLNLNDLFVGDDQSVTNVEKK